MIRSLSVCLTGLLVIGCVDKGDVLLVREGALYSVSEGETNQYIGLLEAKEQTQGKTVCLYRNGHKTAYTITEKGWCEQYAVMGR